MIRLHLTKITLLIKNIKKNLRGGNDDDTLFLAYLNQKHPSIRTINITPCLVEHVDYLIGGSVLFDRKRNINRACYLSDIDKTLVDKLEEDLKNRELY